MTEGAAVVLCGGRSSRMGRAKAWLPWRGQPMLAHVVACMREVVDEVVVVTSEELEPPPVDALLVRDSAPEEGPLRGLAEGLARVEAPLAFVTGTDAPFLHADFVRALLGYGVPVAPVVGGIVQSLAAVYPSAAAAGARELLAARRRRPLELLEAVDYRALEAAELPHIEALRGFNTPDEYLAAVGAAETPARLDFEGSARDAAGMEGLEVPFGPLAQVLARAPGGLLLLEGERVSHRYALYLEGRERVQDTRAPVGPGERVIVRDVRAPDAGKSGLQ